ITVVWPVMYHYSGIGLFLHLNHTKSRQISLLLNGKCHILPGYFIKVIGLLPDGFPFLPKKHAEFISPCWSRYIGSSCSPFHHGAIFSNNGTWLELIHYIPGIVHEHHTEVPFPYIRHIPGFQIQAGPVSVESEHKSLIPIDVGTIWYYSRLNIKPVTFRIAKDNVISFAKSAPIAYINRKLLHVNGAIISPFQRQCIGIGFARLPLVTFGNVIDTFFSVHNNGKGYSFCGVYRKHDRFNGYGV